MKYPFPLLMFVYFRFSSFAEAYERIAGHYFSSLTQLKVFLFFFLAMIVSVLPRCNPLIRTDNQDSEEIITDENRVLRNMVCNVNPHGKDPIPATQEPRCVCSEGFSLQKDKKCCKLLRPLCWKSHSLYMPIPYVVCVTGFVIYVTLVFKIHNVLLI